MIESIRNEKVKQYTKLNLKKNREETNLFIASGEHLVKEALKKENLVKEIFLLKGEANIYGDVTYVTKEILKKVSGLDSAPKVLAICYKKLNNQIEGNIIILDDIKDPGNLGTIIRSAVAFNYQTIILSPESADIYNSKVIRASEGMIFNINIVVTSLEDIIKKLKQQDYLILGTDVNNGLPPKKTTQKHGLIIGSEAGGISKHILSLTDDNFKITTNTTVESLNAGVAASILMYKLNGSD